MFEHDYNFLVIFCSAIAIVDCAKQNICVQRKKKKNISIYCIFNVVKKIKHFEHTKKFNKRGKSLKYAFLPFRGSSQGLILDFRYEDTMRKSVWYWSIFQKRGLSPIVNFNFRTKWKFFSIPTEGGLQIRACNCGKSTRNSIKKIVDSVGRRF